MLAFNNEQALAAATPDWPALGQSQRVGDVVKFLFADFVLDDACFELRRAGQKLEVQPKVLRLLLHLAQRRDRVVAIDELLSTLWRGETVTAASVRRAVKSARRALGESADSSTTIRTVHGYGYQFVAPLSEQAASEPARAAPQPAPARDIHDVVIARAALDHTLEESWFDAEIGRGHAVLLFGEGGAGKSSAMQRLAAYARERGGISWLARAADVEGAPPYWPFISVLREALQHNAGVPWRELIGEGAADMVQALPELRSWLPGADRAPEIEPSAARFRFFDSMLSFLRRTAAHAPLLIVIDDLPLADAPTVQLFSFLAKHAAGSRLLMAAAMRQGTLAREIEAASPELAAFQRAARHVYVPGFAPEEVARFIEAHTGGPVDPQRVARLTEQTAGNPLLLTQLVNLCRPPSRGAAPRWEVLDTLVDNRGLQSAVERLVGHISPKARECLQAAAVLGQRFSRTLLAELLDAPAERVMDWLEEARASGLVTHSDSAVDQSWFSHGLVREALARGQDPLRRQELHGRAAAVLELRGDVEPSEIAHHYLRAGDYARGLDFSVRAARAATQQLAAGAALLHYTHALYALEHLPGNAPLRAELLLERGEAQLQAGAIAEARATFLQAAHLARELGGKTMLARAALAISPPGMSDIDEQEIALLQEALAGLDPGDDLYALVASALAKSLCLGRDLEQRRSALTRALSAARGLRDPTLRGRALGMCHAALSEPEQLSERAKLGRELAAIARGQSDSELLLRAARAQLQDALELGDMQTVEVSLTLIEQLAQQVRDPYARWYAMVYRAMCAFLEGRIEVAMARAEEAHQFGLVIGESTARHCYLVQLSGSLRLLGRAERARELVYEAAARYPSIAGWRCAVALAEVDVGHIEAARTLFGELMAEGLSSLKRDAFVLSMLCPLAELCLWVGDAENAKQLYAALTPYAKHCGTIAFGIATYGPITRYLGALAAQCQKFDLAQQHFEAAARLSSRMKSPTFICLTAVTQAYAALQNTSPPELRRKGHVQLKLARSLAREHGFKVVELVCDALAASNPPQSDGLAAKGRA
jgi:DNA-binding winged helix-turn-helix (wHTH) protein